MDKKIDLIILSDIEHSAPRTTNLIYYLPKNKFNITWITANSEGIVGVDDLPKNFSEKINIKYFNRGVNFFRTAKKIETKNLNISKEKSSYLYSFIRRNLIRIFLSFLFPDPYFFTFKNYVKEFKKIYNKNNKTIIYTSYPYATPLIAAFYLKVKFENIIWVNDYRDLWSQNHNYPFSFFRKYFDKKIELFLIKKMNLITTVSKELKKTIFNDLNTSSFIVYNGFSINRNIFFDPKNFINKNINKKKTYLLHVGSIYPEFQDILPLIESDLKNQNNVELHFMGNINLKFKEIILKKDFGSNIKFIGSYSRGESIEIQKLYDGLIYFESFKNSGVLLLKFFEYINSNKPIICVGGMESTEPKDILNNINRGIFLKKKKDFNNFLKNPKVFLKGIKVDKEQNQKYSYKESSKNLLTLLEKL